MAYRAPKKKAVQKEEEVIAKAEKIEEISKVEEPAEKIEEPKVEVAETFEVKDESTIELSPIKTENENENINMDEITRLREKLNNGTITDGEAAELFNLLKA